MTRGLWLLFCSALLYWSILHVVDSVAVQDPKFTTSKYESVLKNHTRQWVADGHTNNWAVLVSTSIFWHNYRHVANVFGMYHAVKRMGIPDSHIILMVADDIACNARNSFPGTVFNHRNHKLNLYGTNIEVDYRGYEVSVENFLRVLTGKHDENTPRSKRLLTNERSNILIYMTGHGGDEFLKFQDFEEICSKDLADAFEQMWETRRYHEILFMVDTCQAATLYRQFRSPNIIAIGSSAKKENSYSHHSDGELGLAMIDRFTFYTLNFFESGDAHLQTVNDLFAVYHEHQLGSKATYRSDLFGRSISETKVIDFFGAEVVPSPITNATLVELEITEEQEPEEKETEDTAEGSTMEEGNKRGGDTGIFNHFEKKPSQFAFSSEFVAAGFGFLFLAGLSVVLLGKTT